MKRLLTAVACALGLAAAPAHAAVGVAIDLASLNELLPALSLQEVLVPVPGGRTIRVQLDDLRIVAFAPAAGAGTVDQILTAVKLRVPALGLDLALEPRMSLAVVEHQGASLLELRFDEVGIPLPLAGSIDAAPFLTPLRFPAEDLFQIAGARGDVTLRSRLASITMDQHDVRLAFDVKVVDPAAKPAAAPSR